MLAGLQRGYIHPPASKRKGKIEPTQRDHRIGKHFPRAILNLGLYWEPVNRKQLIQEQWGLSPPPGGRPWKPSAVQMAGWHIQSAFVFFLYMVRYFLLTLYIAFLLSPLPVALSFRMWGDKERLQGLAKMLEQPQTLSHRLMAWQCSLLVMPDGLCTKVSTFQCSSGSRFRGESREYCPPPAKAPQNVPPCLIALFRDIYFSKWPHFSVTKTGILYQNLSQSVAFCPASQT